MPARKSPPWTGREIAILSDVYPREGIGAAADALPDRSWRAIYAMASRLKLQCQVLPDAPKAKLQGERLEEAIRLREVEGWGFARIGAHFGISETGASNAILIAMSPRKGFTPAARDDAGRLTPESIDRLRWMLRKGLKPVEIQLRLGLSAGRIAEERRRYNADLKERGKALLPPPGGGEAYSGAKVARDRRAAVERLFMDGLGTKKIHEETGVSNTTIVRIRARLVKRLARKGEALPGCDASGRRRAAKISKRYVPETTIAALKQRLLDRVPVRRAARDLGIGLSAAYRIRDQLRAQLEEQGHSLPAPILPGRDSRAARAAEWLPRDKFYRYRELSAEHGPQQAKSLLLAEISAEQQADRERRARRPRTFEEQLAAVAAGARLTNRLNLTRPAPDMTLGGVATGAL